MLISENASFYHLKVFMLHGEIMFYLTIWVDDMPLFSQLGAFAILFSQLGAFAIPSFDYCRTL